MSKNILILAGTTLARNLTDELHTYPDISATVCLTRKTKGYEKANKQIEGLITGPEQLLGHIKTNNISHLIDATHPFAAQISSTALSTSLRADIPLLTLQYPPWKKTSLDHWIEVKDHRAAIKYLASLTAGQHIFLTTGGRMIAEYAKIRHLKFTARCIETNLDQSIENVTVITQRGPFALNDEKVLFESNNFDYLVTKNSGGLATCSKISLTREQGIPVVMIKRPEYKTGQLFESVSSIVNVLQTVN